MFLYGMRYPVLSVPGVWSLLRGWLALSLVLPVGGREVQGVNMSLVMRGGAGGEPVTGLARGVGGCPMTGNAQ